MAGMVNPSETYTAWSIGEGAHEVTGLKPMLNPEEQVALLKAKGVSFERCGEEQAADALARRGTFVHLASCRRLFQKHASGDDRGKYVRLDFADLLALDALDDELRKAFLAVSQDVERLAKTSMVTRASRLDDEDGYGIVADFMRAQQRRYRSYIERDLSSRMSAGIVGDVYTGASSAITETRCPYGRFWRWSRSERRWPSACSAPSDGTTPSCGRSTTSSRA